MLTLNMFQCSKLIENLYFVLYCIFFCCLFLCGDGLMIPRINTDIYLIGVEVTRRENNTAKRKKEGKLETNYTNPPRFKERPTSRYRLLNLFMWFISSILYAINFLLLTPSIILLRKSF